MPLATPFTTFGDLARDHLEIEVTCGNCGQRRTIDAAAPRLRNRKVAGARFRCEQCGSVGLPTIGKQRRWPGRLADHADRIAVTAARCRVCDRFGRPTKLAD
jgi:hypothetical protein